MNKSALQLTLLCAIALSSGNAFAESLTIPASANIFGAGHTVAPAPAGLGEGTLPPSIAVTPGQALSFNVSGTVSPNILYYPASPYAEADGGTAFAPTGITSYGGISGIKADTTMFLVGVFLDDSTPADPAPVVLDFSAVGLGTSFENLSPGLRQTFFIGDGRTGASNSVVQTFIPPAGATRLFFGFADGYSNGTLTGEPGFYVDNDGTLNLTVNSTNASDCEMVLAEANARIATLSNEVAQLSYDLAESSNLLASVQLANSRPQKALTAAAGQIASLKGQKLALSNRLKNVSNAMALLTTDFRSTFKDPTFSFPGSTPEQQLANLTAAMRRLPQWDKAAIYKVFKKK